MNCREIKEQLPFYDPHSKDEAHRKIREHLSVCSSCSADYNSNMELISRITDVMNEMTPQSEDDFYFSVMKKIKSKEKAQHFNLRLIAVAAVITIVALTSFYVGLVEWKNYGKGSYKGKVEFNVEFLPEHTIELDSDETRKIIDIQTEIEALTLFAGELSAMETLELFENTW